MRASVFHAAKVNRPLPRRRIQFGIDRVLKSFTIGRAPGGSGSGAARDRVGCFGSVLPLDMWFSQRAGLSEKWKRGARLIQKLNNGILPSQKQGESTYCLYPVVWNIQLKERLSKLISN